MVVKDFGGEGDFLLGWNGFDQWGALEFTAGAGFAAVEMDATLDDVDVRGGVLAVEGVLVVVGVVVLLADAVAEFLELELETVVGAGGRTLGGGAVG